jgi:hypothetical protein
MNTTASMDISVEAGVASPGSGRAGDLNTNCPVGGDLELKYTTGMNGTSTTISGNTTLPGYDLLK